jgi:hypothetical protein
MYFSNLDKSLCVGTAVALPPDQTTNPNTEDKKMRTDGQTVRGNEMDLGGLKAWAKRTFSKERTSAAISKLVVAAYAGICLAQVLQSY